MKGLRFALVVFIGALLAGSAGAVERRIVEMEEAEGLVRYPYENEDAAGWYARESSCRHYGAPGKSYHAQIHDGAKKPAATAKLAKPLPAGRYKVFVRVVGTNWYDKPNIVEVSLGGASASFKWTSVGKRFKWLEGKLMDTKEPVETVILKAVQFGGNAFGHLNHSRKRTLAVDSVYITSNLAEHTGPTPEGAVILELGRDAPVELLAGGVKTARRTVLHAETPLPLKKPRTGPVQLAAFDGRRNMWPSSSFEIGGNDGWAARNSVGYIHAFDETDHVKGRAVNGAYYRCVPARSRAMSRPFYLGKPGVYNLSLFVRSEKAGKAQVHLVRLDPKRVKYRRDTTLNLGRKLITSAVNLTDNWQRVSANGRLTEGLVLLQVEPDIDCFIDAVQLETGDRATAYQPRAEIEAGFATTAKGNILHDDGPTILHAWAHNSGDKATVALLSYDIVDVREEQVGRGTVQLDVPAGETVSKEIVISPTRRGLFSVFYAAQARTAPEGELVYAVLPAIPSEMPRHALACNMDNNAEAHGLMQQMGHKWQLYCKLKADSPKRLHPGPNTWNWETAREVIAMPAKAGFKTMPCLWPLRCPPHMLDKKMSSHEAVASSLRDFVRGTSKKRIPGYPNLKYWRAYCRKVAEKLSDVAPMWTIEDEVEGGYSPREYAPVVKATAAGFADSGKPMKISLSCMPDYAEDLIEELGGKPLFDAFGGSTYNFEYWDAAKVRRLQKRYGLPWHCIGVGQTSQPQMFHSFTTYRPVYSSAARTAREMVLLCLAQDAKILGHYTGRISAPWGLYNMDFPLMDYDCSPLAHGFSYSCIPLLLANAVPVKDIYVEPLDALVFVYRQNGKLGAVTWAGNTPTLDIHWKTWPRTWSDFTLEGDVEVLDMYGNPRKDVKRPTGKTVFTLTEEPVFILNRNMPEADFIAMIASANAAPPPVEMRLAFLPDGKGGIDLGVWTRNNTARTLRNLKLDANFPENRMTTKTAWIIADRKGVTPMELAPGKETFGRFKTTLTTRFPVEDATFTVWLNADGKDHAWYEKCWMTTAPRIAGKVDGELEEWAGVQPAWLYYTFSWARFGRGFPQLIEGGENFKYCKRVDGRAAIRTGYDEKNLYVAIACDDDDPIFSGPPEKRDSFVLRFDKDLLGDFGPKARKPDVELTVLPAPGGTKVLEAPGATAVLKQNGKSYVVEIAVPLALVSNKKASAGSAIGFDLVWADADRDGDRIEVGRMRWAGGNRTMGQIFFGN